MHLHDDKWEEMKGPRGVEQLNDQEGGGIFATGWTEKRHHNPTQLVDGAPGYSIKFNKKPSAAVSAYQAFGRDAQGQVVDYSPMAKSFIGDISIAKELCIKRASQCLGVLCWLRQDNCRAVISVDWNVKPPTLAQKISPTTGKSVSCKEYQLEVTDPGYNARVIYLKRLGKTVKNVKWPLTCTIKSKGINCPMTELDPRYQGFIGDLLQQNDGKCVPKRGALPSDEGGVDFYKMTAKFNKL